MLRDFLFTGLILGLLLFGTPASAFDYTGTARLDLTSLTFSGINFTLTPQDTIKQNKYNQDEKDWRDFGWPLQN